MAHRSLLKTPLSCSTRYSFSSSNTTISRSRCNSGMGNYYTIIGRGFDSFTAERTIMVSMCWTPGRALRVSMTNSS